MLYLSKQNYSGDAIASLQGLDGRIIADSEVHELITEFDDILDSALSK